MVSSKNVAIEVIAITVITWVADHPTSNQHLDGIMRV
jgi:hypothetical protein